MDNTTYKTLREAGLSHYDAMSSLGLDSRISYFWPSDHKSECERRIRLLHRLRADPELARAAHIHYKHHPVDWCLDWATTYDPRNATRGLPTLMPFSMFERQTDLIQFLHSCVLDEENGLIEKARDMGATVAASAFSVWLWLYWPGAAIGFGSRKEELVDRLGDPKTIFDKLRSCIRNLPSDLFWPKGFHPDKHMTYMKIINPSNGATIAGEAGDNIGRGGRTLIYFKDEAQPVTSLVLTPSGFVQMGEIQPGDKVIGAKGEPVSVTHINPCGSHETYRVHFSDGTYADCSENHLWTLNKTWGKRETVTRRLSAFKDDYFYESPGGQKQYKYRVPVCKPVQFDNPGELPLHPYIVGVLLGDGSIKHVPKYRPSFTSIDQEIVDNVSSRLPDDCVLSHSEGTMEYRLNDATGRRGQGKISRASAAIMSAGIAGHGAETKFIPDMYKMSSVTDRIELLQGLMDTDGSASGGVASFHSCSERLARDVMFVVQSLGGTATLNVKPDHRGFRDMFVLHMWIPDVTPFKLTRKIKALRPRKHPTMRTIVNIESLGKQPVKCITVDSPDGLYLTDNFIVTHNSAHYERPELIEAALGDNTNVQIDISSVNGMGNVFHRRRMAGFEWNPGCTAPPGKTRIFIMDWSDHPGKTQTWYDARRQKAEDEGLLHVFAQEVDRDYSAAVENILIPAAWVQAAKGAHLKLNLSPSGKRTAGMDVADGGSDVNALCMMRGMLVEHMETLAGDGDDAYYDFHAKAAQRGAHEFWYDVTGIGRAAKVAAKNTENEMPVFAWVPSGAVVNPHESIMGEGDEDVTRTNRDHYATLKAQAWFYLRRRFKKTFDWVRNGIPCDPDDIISLPEKAPWVDKLITELGQVTYGYQSGGKVIVNKAPAGTKSPNMADALVIAAMQPKPNAKVIARRATPRAGLVQSGAGNYDGL